MAPSSTKTGRQAIHFPGEIICSTSEHKLLSTTCALKGVQFAKQPGQLVRGLHQAAVGTDRAEKVATRGLPLLPVLGNQPLSEALGQQQSHRSHVPTRAITNLVPEQQSLLGSIWQKTLVFVYPI